MPAALLLAQKGVDATVTISHSQSQDLQGLCLDSDIIVARLKAGHDQIRLLKEDAIVLMWA